jgi:hypothetical protein
MKVSSILASLTIALSLATVSSAAELQPGSYLMKTDAMQMKIDVIKLPTGALAINGEGKSSAGTSCRIGDLGSIQGNSLVLGMCSVPIAFTEDGFELQASPSCIQCQPGASIQGRYVKQ